MDRLRGLGLSNSLSWIEARGQIFVLATRSRPLPIDSGLRSASQLDLSDHTWPGSGSARLRALLAGRLCELDCGRRGRHERRRERQ
jgi:hypothetical protein